MSGLKMFVQEKQFRSSYLRIYIGLSPRFSQLIIESARQKSTQQTPILGITYLTEDQVNQAFADPLNTSLRTLFAVPYEQRIEATQGILAGIGDIPSKFKSIPNQKVEIEEALTTLEMKKKDVTGDTRNSLDSAINSLKSQYKLLNNIENTSNHNLKELDTNTTVLEDIAEQHRKAWVQFRKKYIQEINLALTSSDLSEALIPEKDNLLREDNWQQLIDRLNDTTGAAASLSAPQVKKSLDLSKPSYETYFKLYFKLKAYLSLYSMNFPPESIVKHLEGMNSIFEKAHQEGTQITQHQEAEIHKIAAEKFHPILEVVNSNQQILKDLDENRPKILEKLEVVTAQDLEAMKIKVQARISGPAPAEPSTPSTTPGAGG